MQLSALEHLLPLASGAALGVSSMPHCAAMCGALAASSCGRSRSAAAPWRYQVGRLIGYGFAGRLAGQAGQALVPLGSGVWPQRVFAALVVGSALVVAVRLLRPRGGAVVAPERLLRGAGRGALEPPRAPSTPEGSAFSEVFARASRLLPREPGLLGALTALLPCGALYAALLLAAATQHADAGMLVMIGFVVPSGLALSVVSAVVRRLDAGSLRFGARAVAAVVVLCASVWMANPLRAAQGTGAPDAVHAPHSCH